MEKSVKHVSIPVFVVHEGCPHTCLFCNQRKITGTANNSIEKARDTIEGHLKTLRGDEEVQIAFFGGSFTAIERERMMNFLSLSDEYVEKGLVHSVRLSTRPDAVGEEILGILKKHHVRDVELGIQSLDDSVLIKNERGHTAEQAISAMKRVADFGFRLTGQMMTGMYGADPESELYTAVKIAESGAVCSRIYPTVVFRNTALSELLKNGDYMPPTLEESVERTWRVWRVFKERGVQVLRVGLCSTDGVRGEDAESVFHEAWGELILSREALNVLEHELEELGAASGERFRVSVPRQLFSQYVGHKKQNKTFLENRFGIKLDFHTGEEFKIEKYEIQ